MEAELFKDIIVPVIGGLGIFMLGLEFMSNGIHALAVNKMRAALAKLAGTPITGLMAGTLITGVIQSSTAMTVMVVGLVNAGVLGLRPAISVIMGANIGTTLTNSLIALPLGLYGLLCAGIAALVMVFAKSESTKNIALAVLGFALIFYGLSMMTGGLRPLRDMPEVMSVISGLNADSYTGILYCVLVAAAITAFIHSSSATIGIVMGLGASGVLDWQTALAFSLGADLGTTITSFIASLNLSRNAKRAAYAHISFNFIGVAVMLPLFPFATQLVAAIIGDPGQAVMVDGRDTYPLVPLAVGVYSTAFNIFNVILLFPFIGTFERFLSRVGATAAEDVEDYSVPRYLKPELRGDLAAALPAIQAESKRYLGAISEFLGMAKGDPSVPSDAKEHHTATDILGRDLRSYTSSLFVPGMSYERTDLVASLIEEQDFAASLGESLYQIARRVERETFSEPARELVDLLLERTSAALSSITGEPGDLSNVFSAEAALPGIVELRERCLRLGDTLSPSERGAILALLGSVERAMVLIERIDTERRSVSRTVAETFEVPEREQATGLQPGVQPV